MPHKNTRRFIRFLRIASAVLCAFCSSLPMNMNMHRWGTGSSGSSGSSGRRRTPPRSHYGISAKEIASECQSGLAAEDNTPDSLGT